MIEKFQGVMSLTFWLELLKQYTGIGPLAPVTLAALESIIPPLPLVAIVTLNVAAYGPGLGFFYSWTGTCIGCTLVFGAIRLLFGRWAASAAKRWEMVERARKWVTSIRTPALFLILILPFTPSAFMNFAFGVTNYPTVRYLVTLYLAKLVMIGSLAAFGQSAVYAVDDPRFAVLSVLLLVMLWAVSRQVKKHHDL